MANTIKARAQAKGGVVTVKALINHPMETGLRKDKKTGKVIPAHYIQEVTCKHGDAVAMDAQWGGAISTNPYVSFKMEGAKKGDTVSLSWVDNKGNKDTKEAKVK
jgi:sulfur-oxidizing protein SoxZ